MGLEGGIALKADLMHFGTRALINHDDQLGGTGCIRCLYFVRNCYIRIAVATVVIDHVAACA